MIVIPNLDQLRISGITGIQQIYPVDAKVLQIIKEEVKDRENSWFLILNPIRMRITGITPEKLANLVTVCGLKVTRVKSYYLAVESVDSPIKFLNKVINEDEKRERELDKQDSEKRKKGVKVERREVSPINKASKLVFADCTGSNLTELLATPGIDSTRTYCNDVHQIYQAFGIEAARAFLIKELIDVIGVEEYINPRHITLLVDFMSSRGKINGITFSGVSRQPIGALEKASIEKAMETFAEAGGFGESNEASSTSSSIFIGKKAMIGTGFNTEYIKPEQLERYEKTRKELLEDKNLVLDINSFNNAVTQFNIGTGEEVALLDSDINSMFGLSTEGETGIKPEGVEVKKQIETKITNDNSNNTPLIKGQGVYAPELDTIAESLESEMFGSMSCDITGPTETVTTAISGGVVTAEIVQPLISEVPPPVNVLPSMSTIKPRKQVQIFSLEEFMK
jgi:hypothetical protein